MCAFDPRQCAIILISRLTPRLWPVRKCAESSTKSLLKHVRSRHALDTHRPRQSHAKTERASGWPTGSPTRAGSASTQTSVVISPTRTPPML